MDVLACPGRRTAVEESFSPGKTSTHHIDENNPPGHVTVTTGLSAADVWARRTTASQIGEGVRRQSTFST